MTAVNYSNIEKNFKKYFDKIINDYETFIITRSDRENVVLLSENEYNNMLENLYIRSNEKDYAELLESIQQLKNGNSRIRELIDE